MSGPQGAHRSNSAPEKNKLRQNLPTILMVSGLVYCLTGAVRAPSTSKASPTPPQMFEMNLKTRVALQGNRELQASALRIDLVFPSIPRQAPFRLVTQDQNVSGSVQVPLTDDACEVVVQYPGYSSARIQTKLSKTVDIGPVTLAPLLKAQAIKTPSRSGANSVSNMGSLQAVAPHHKFRPSPIRSDYGTHTARIN